MAREFYRYISYDSRDTAQVQFYVRTINNAPYLGFTFINPVNQDWIDSIEPDDLIAFYQDGIDRGTAKILAAYDAEEGFRLEAAPALNEGQYYEIRFSRTPPFPDAVPTPPENRGWSPVLALASDGERRVLRVRDWVGGQGTKPQLGFIGASGLVGAIANGIDIRGATGRSTTWTEGNTLPASAVVGDHHLFTQDVASGLTNYFEANGTTARTKADAGDIARYDGTKWLLVVSLLDIISSVVEDYTRAFDDSLDLGTWENASGAVSGHYARKSATQIDVAYRNIANENKETEIRAILPGYGLQFGDKIFVIEWTNQDAGYRQFNGFWANGEADATAESSRVAISVIQHELRMIRFITEAQLESKLGVVGSLKGLTSDLHVTKEVGDFADVTDAAIGGISFVPTSTTPSPRDINFAGLTYSNPSVVAPFNTPVHVVVRIATTSGVADSQFHIYDTYLKRSQSLGGFLHSDANWFYYSHVDYTAGLRAGVALTLQRRSTHTHTRYDGELGSRALAQVDARIPEHQSLDTLNDKTSDIHVNKDVSDFQNVSDTAIAGIGFTQATTQVNHGIVNKTFDVSGITNWQASPITAGTEGSDISYALFVRVAKSLGRIESQFSLFTTGNRFTRYQLGELYSSDANWNYYFISDVGNGNIWNLQRRSTHTHTRFDGELGDPALEQVDARIPEHETSQALENKVDNLENKTADLHVQETQPPFANLTNATIGGIAVGVANGTTRAALAAETYDFSALTFANPSATVPRSATTNYFVFVRVAKSLGKIEPRFRVYAQDFGDGINFPLGQLVGSDANWNYYTPTEGGPSDVWILQYRETHSHTRFDGELGDAALEQVNAQIPEQSGATLSDLEDKTSDIHINDPPGPFANLTDSAIGGVAAFLETTEVLAAISAGTYNYASLTWNNPSVAYSPTRGQEYRVVVRVAKTTVETQFRVLLVHAIGDTQRYYGIGQIVHTDASWNYYTAVTGDLAATATLEYRETHTHTRWDGELGATAIAQVDARVPAGGPGGTGLSAAQLARLLPEIPSVGQRDGKIAKFLGDVLTWIVDPDTTETLNNLADRVGADEQKLANFIQTVNNYFSGHGEGDVTAQEIAHLFALLDEYNPVIDDIRSTLGLVSELGEPTRLIQGYDDQTTFLSNAAVPSTLPKIEYKLSSIGAEDADDILVQVTGEAVTFDYTNLAGIHLTVGSGGVGDPFLRYYLNGDTDDADAIQDCGFFIYDNRLYILLSKHEGAGSDPLAAFTSATLRPYISYAPLDNLAVDGTITKQAVETLAPTNADHDVSFIPSFATESPERAIRIKNRDARGWYFNNTDSGTTFNSILAKWYSDLQWLSRMYERYRLAVEHVEQGRGGVDPRVQNWIDGSKNPANAGASVIRPPYPSLDALKAAFPIPDLTFYFKLSVDGMVMNLADHDIHRPKRNKLVQIPDTHYNTPPRVTFLPTTARENEVFQLVSDQYRPDSDHTWTFEPAKLTLGGRTVAGASIPTTLGRIHEKIGQTSDTVADLPAIFQRSALNAIVAFADDPEHLHLYLNPQRASTTDVLTVEIHGLRSDRSPIVRTATFRYAETFSISADTIRRFQSRVGGAYGIMDLSETISVSIKRGNTYLYLNPANTPPSPEWDTGLLHTAGLYKGLADGSFVKAEFPTLDTWNHVVARSNTYFSGTNPQASVGVDNQFWVNLRTGQIYQKSSGTWSLITDVALQTEISRAIEWSTIPNNTQIPENFITRVSGRYYGAKATHTKTSGSTAPTGDTTNWIELSNEATTGSSAQTLVWADIAANTSIPVGTLVNHGGATFAAIATHTKSATGPDGDSTNWIILSNWGGTWSDKWYPQGTMVERSGSPYIANQNVNRGDPAPDASGNTKWLRMNADATRLLPTLPASGSRAEKVPIFDGNTLEWAEKPVRYIKLSINSGITVPIPTEAATPLTFAAAALATNDATGFLARHSAGNQITLKAGSYQIDNHVVLTPSNVNERSSYTIEIYQGSTKLDETKYIDYVRAFNQLGPPEAIDSSHLITLASDGEIQIRIKMSIRGGSSLTVATAADGKVTVRRL